MKRIIVIIGLLISCLCFNTKLSAQSILDDHPNEGLYMQGSVEEGGTGYYKPMNYPTIREADVMWRKRVWRTIDFRQKMNQVFFYPTETHYNWSNFMQILIDNWRSGDIKAYEVELGKDELNKPYQYSNFASRFEKVSRNADGDSLVTGFDVTQVKMLNIMEDWYFDRQRSQLMVRILAISPVLVYEDGKEPEQLFWVSYNSATREVLAKSNFFNRDNPGAALNYDQVFMMRLFDSYIYKEENPYDRRISSYASGVKALYESERIKQEIIDFEQNLWEY